MTLKEGSQRSIGGLKSVCQSPDLNPVEHLRAILDWRLREHFLPPSTKHQIMEFLMEEWCPIPPIEFHPLVKSMPRHIEAVLAIKTSMLVFPLFCELPVFPMLR